ncbi:MAG: triose-phosphate isomerase [Patescibacteria group bacterium]
MKIIVGNWKMYLDEKQSVAFAKKLNKLTPKHKFIICPSFTSIEPVGRVLDFKKMSLGSQDAFWSDFGAYTGEVSALDLKRLKCKYIILGHSERRKYFGETYETVNKKLKHVLEIGLTPIVCVGESAEERKAKKTWAVIKKQLDTAFRGIKKDKQILVAYEPIWAIGTGNPETPEDANKIQKAIKKNLKSPKIKVLYGGSVDAKNYKSFLKEKNIDGLLIGGASVKFKEISKIINNL